jgi:hypothetical protein
MSWLSDLGTRLSYRIPGINFFWRETLRCIKLRSKARRTIRLDLSRRAIFPFINWGPIPCSPSFKRVDSFLYVLIEAIIAFFFGRFSHKIFRICFQSNRCCFARIILTWWFVINSISVIHFHIEFLHLDLIELHSFLESLKSNFKQIELISLTSKIVTIITHYWLTSFPDELKLFYRRLPSRCVGYRQNYLTKQILVQLVRLMSRGLDSPWI